MFEKITSFFLGNYPVTAYYVPNCCQWQFLLKYSFHNYCHILQNQHRSHGPTFMPNQQVNIPSILGVRGQLGQCSVTSTSVLCLLQD